MDNNGDANMADLDDAQLRALIADINHRLGVLGVRNENLTRVNEELQHRNQAAAVDLTDARGRIERMEVAWRDGGLPVNGGGGAHATAGRGGQAPPPPPPPGPPRNPRLPNLRYDGKEEDDWTSFREAFVNNSRFHGYSDQQAKWALKSCMKGPAFLSIQGLDHEDDQLSATDLLNAYEAKFMPLAASDLSRARFETATQEAKEHLLQWHGRLQMLFVRAYGGHGQAMGEAMLIRAFARGIRNRRIREHVLRSQPATYDAALGSAQTEQAVLDSANYIPGSAPPFATNIAGQSQAGHGANQGRGEPMEIGAMGTGKIQCHTCHLFGHIARDCGLVKKPAANDAAGGARQRPRQGGARGGAAAKDGKGEKDKRPQRYRRFINAIENAAKHLEGDEDDEGEEDTDSKEKDEAEGDEGEENEENAQDFSG